MTAATPTSTKPVRRRRSRAERARENREALINAAASIVGESGYEAATIAEVTRRAGLSLGLFYQYFESRDDLFRQLLPAVGSHLIATLGQEFHDAKSVVEGEVRSIKTYFDYVSSGSPIMRVFKEAEVYAPEAYNNHMANVLQRYTKSLRRQKEAGSYRGFTDRELRVVAVLLTSARLGFYEQLVSKGEDPAWVSNAFAKIIKALSQVK
ncbi:TetR/AcrR family transcriptional regulator [Ferrovibrio sp. MS7]|uniref:TetR/AcrR family transcriptional regulator n=1 Tax=Ferrovibrio plantarum TaxID=3119164 RepID=UPI003134D2E5